ncbi:DUF1674 domain-containing protein [Marivibrio halodurans]|uniref:DUF1674 domain-containing protein n=1 Tax=Marivibrio halodurans TaxID=2039722 RepID=A0A8J7V5C9_9PROT|nr:succinate dehydrogenase assembly factor 4 [Marivibrio halodurans]MBP5858769.1 DUF1674 domain-containing protein [Marivibrio halodurans]
MKTLKDLLKAGQSPESKKPAAQGAAETKRPPVAEQARAASQAAVDAGEAPLIDPEVKGVDARRLAELKAEEAGRRWRLQAEASGQKPRETGGPQGLEPTRYGDWEKAGRCYDF